MNKKPLKLCKYCGKKKHYAKGLCHSCYERLRTRKRLEYYEPFTTSYYERHKEERKQYRLKNKEKIKESLAKYYKKNKKRISEYKKTWYLNNREKILKKAKEKNEMGRNLG